MSLLCLLQASRAHRLALLAEAEELDTADKGKGSTEELGLVAAGKVGPCCGRLASSLADTSSVEVPSLGFKEAEE